MELHELTLVILACIFGGLVGSLVTVHVFVPDLNSLNANRTDEIIQNVYPNQSQPLQDTVTAIFSNNKQSVVYVDVLKVMQTPFGTISQEASGSGFIVSEDGYIVTNDHVVSDSTNITIVLFDGEEFQANLKGADPLNDVAVIKINAPNALRPVQVGDSDDLTAGDFVVAIGSPFRLQNTITFGIVSALNRQLTSQGGFVIEKVIQTDAAVNPGNSGGPLINLDGNVIGINTAIISQSGGSEGIGFAIPINTVKKIYTQLIDSGKVSRPWLGITGTDVTSDMVTAWKLTVNYGVLIVDFADNSPAKEAGLRETLSRPGRPDFILGDIIMSIGGKKITNNVDLLNVLLKYNPGNNVEVGVYRDSTPLTFNVTLGERPPGV